MGVGGVRTKVLGCARLGHQLETCALRRLGEATGSRSDQRGARAGEAEWRNWQGRKDSNLRMPESESGALTNLATPLTKQ